MSGGRGRGGRPLAVGCECQSATNQREGSHERVSALQGRVQAGENDCDQSRKPGQELGGDLVRLPSLRCVAFGLHRPSGHQEHDGRPDHQSFPVAVRAVGCTWTAGPPVAVSIPAYSARAEAAPVAVLGTPPGGARTRSSRSASATSATWARVSAPCGLKSFSACSTTWAEIALPSASATTLNAIHPRWMVLLSSRCTAGPLLLGGWAEHIGPQLMARDASLAFDGQTMMGCHRPTPAHPLPNQGRLNSDSLGECALAADLVYRNSNWAVHARTIALLLLIGNSAARGIR